MTDAPTLRFALAYAARGLHVFPLAEGGKKPRAGSRGLLDAAINRDVINGWWRENPHYNVAIRTGAVSGLLVLDLDVDAEKCVDGRMTLSILEEEHGALPPTWTVRTARGGRHYYFRHPGGDIPPIVGLRHGLDIRADGAYVVSPPSRSPVGAWVWDEDRHPRNTPLATAPNWLLTMIAEHRSADPSAPPAREVDSTIPEGKRDSVLTSLAGSMRRRGMSADEIEVAIQAVNERRCKPALPSADIRRIAQSVGRYQPTPSPQEPPVAAYLPALYEIPADLGRMDSLAFDASLQAVLGPTASNRNWRESVGADWLVEGFLQRGSVTLLSAVGGRGKSMLAQDCWTRVAAGDYAPWLGVFTMPNFPCSVAIIEAECGLRRLDRRCRELVMGGAFEPSVADLAIENIDVFPADTLRKRGLVLRALPLLLTRKKYDLVVLDPLRSFLPDVVEDENGNLAMGRVVDFLVACSKTFGTSFLVVDHDNRQGAAARGASSKSDAAEFIGHIVAPDLEDQDYLELVMEKQRDPGGARRTAFRRVGGRPTEDGLWPVRFDATDTRDIPRPSGSNGASRSFGPSKGFRLHQILSENQGVWYTTQRLCDLVQCDPALIRNVARTRNWESRGGGGRGNQTEYCISCAESGDSDAYTPKPGTNPEPGISDSGGIPGGETRNPGLSP